MKKTIDRVVFVFSQVEAKKGNEFTMTSSRLDNLGRNFLRANYQTYNDEYSRHHKDLYEVDNYVFSLPDILSYDTETLCYGLLMSIHCLNYNLSDEIKKQEKMNYIIEDCIKFLCSKLDIKFDDLFEIKNYTKFHIFNSNEIHREFYC